MAMEIALRTPHAGQREIYSRRTRRNAVRCGRRYGKTIMIEIIGGNAGAKGKKIGIFTPESKQWAEIYDAIEELLAPIKKSSDRTRGKFRTIHGGKIDFWSVNDNYLAGRGREYDLVLIDEAAFGKNKQFMEIWNKAIAPTMLTTRGVAWAFSTPFGNDPDNFFYAICNDKSLGWTEFHAPTSANPYVPADELELERIKNHPLVFKQEFLAEFVDWSGVAFFSEENLLVNGDGVLYPMSCDYVFAVIDSAMKDGSGNDGTAVIYCGVSKKFGHPLTILDWDIVQINSDLLTAWLPGVFHHLEFLARETKSRGGSAGAFIEDKASGITLNQHSARMGWPAQPIDGAITAIGKDGRAVNASGAVHRGEVKMSGHAYRKEKEFKGTSRNHLMSQVTGYRIGDKDAAKRADDLYDAFAYSVIIALGGNDGF